MQDRLKEFMAVVDQFDWYGHFSDDQRKWRKQADDSAKMRQLKAKMTSLQLRKAEEYFELKRPAMGGRA